MPTPVTVSRLSTRASKGQGRAVRALRSKGLLKADASRTFGVEIEQVGLDDYAVIAVMQSLGLECKAGWGEADLTEHGAWNVKTDCSINDDCRCEDECVCTASERTGYYRNCRCWDGCCCERRPARELVSPPLRGQAGLDVVRAVLETLQDAGAEVNEKCGLHVHVAASDLTPNAMKRICAYYNSAQDALFRYTSIDREDNQYCPTLDSRTYFERLFDQETTRAMCDYTPRGVVNLQKFPESGTIEFRQHEGCLDPDKVTAWVQFCLGLVRLSRALHKRASIETPFAHQPRLRTLEEVASVLWLDQRAYDQFALRSGR